MSTASLSILPIPVTFEGFDVKFTLIPQNLGTPGPTGAVELFDGPTDLGGATITGPWGADNAVSGYFGFGIIEGLSVGTHSLSVHYSGDANFAPSTSLVVTTDIAKSPTSGKFNSSTPSAFVGQPLSLSVMEVTGAHLRQGA